MNPLISVVMPVYNQEAYIAEALESVLAQTYTNLEILISDDCSKDASLEIIKSYAARDARIKVLPSERNLGICGNFNKLFDSVSGEFLAFFSGDDVMMPEKLATQLAVLQQHPEVVVVHHDALFINESGTITGRHSDNTLPLRNPLDWALKADWFHVRRIAPVMPTSCLARTNYYLHARYDDRFKYKHELLFTIEDYANAPEGKWYYIKQPLMKYRKHADNFTVNPLFTRHMNAERKLLADVARKKAPALSGRVADYELFAAYEAILFNWDDGGDTLSANRSFFADHAPLHKKIYLALAKALNAVRLYWPVSNALHRYIYRPFY